MKGQLHDKVASATGGGTGVGEAICVKFAREGAKVVVNGLPDDPIADVVTTILDGGGDAIPFAGDVAVDEQARGRVHATIAKYGRLDVLVNNAGVLLANAETDDPPRLYGGCGGGTGAVWRARQLRVSRHH
jgi:NAD(P)-dependent dehydrogenase (short-subunit alcohol dehydrogenase family)